MNCLLCIVPLLSLICALTHNEVVHKLYKKSEGSNTGILKQLPITDGPGRPGCAIACMQTDGCQSFTLLCQLQTNGYGSMVESKSITTHSKIKRNNTSRDIYYLSYKVYRNTQHQQGYIIS